MKTHKILLVTTLLTLQAACSPDSGPENETTRAEKSDPNTVRLTEKQEAITGVKCEMFSKRPLANLIKAPGFIDSPPQYKATINPYITIFVKKVHVIVGDRVSKGDVVVTASSPEYVSLQQEYLQTLSSLNTLESDFERKASLNQENISSRREFEAARAAFQTASARKAALQSNLQLMGADIARLEEGEIHSEMYIRSPISGKISALQTSVGQHSAPHEVLMEVINSEHLHLEMKVLEQDVPGVKEGQPVIFTLPDFEKQLFRGEIYRVGNTIDPKGRFVQVHAHLENENEGFLPGMFINSHIVTQQDSVWTVPAEAIVREGSDTFLFVLRGINGNGRIYQRKQVRTGIETMGYTAILNPGDSLYQDSVVVSGAYYLSNALNEAGGHDH
ncbi:membrane fusion protein, cobalt-zinc-cadmium efflux system [Cyclobacterium lianum]|uniref:Membrane fusion protein, cobalt-zinc-cadmium efflux system n=1 Tax=Cyclobacterium lianum TaxID=388280 RepID=A0A1M7NYD2_9BACT|nr:efflux RND transporter periplasmic adaptor subunit [Cyclobacterium lianum]SHN09182.1 membrane fusion protein, cobalt-zinc-cadmium efflux system [Cyclobacterium lianum]